MRHATRTSQPLTLHALRLMPGDDLRGALEGYAREHGIRAGAIVSAVGSLREAHLRFAGRDEGIRTVGDLEIVALSGTVAVGGVVHLHAAVADADGAVVGGHLLKGSIVRTTAEVVIGELQGVTFERAHDPATAFAELWFR